MKKRLDKVIVSIEEDGWITSGLEHEVNRAIDEYIDRQFEAANELFRQGRVEQSREIIKKLDLLITFKVNYVEEKN